LRQALAEVLAIDERRLAGSDEITWRATAARPALRATLAITHFHNRCFEASKRDAPETAIENGRRVLRLADPDLWQHLLLTQLPEKPPDIGTPEGKAYDAWLDELVPLLIQLWERVLAPWFEGEQMLNYEWLRKLIDSAPPSDWLSALDLGSAAKR
jgi:hypothetical protein